MLPGRPSEACPPVIGCTAVFLPFPPYIIIPVWIILGFPAFHKPLMFIGSVVHHQVHHNPDSPFMGLCQHLIKILHRSELIHNIPVIADIIPIVIIRRLIHRRQPNHIHSQILQIIQPAGNPLQIPDTIPVAVHKASGINLINYRLFPPCFNHNAIPPVVPIPQS
ncbi:hypothetical protein IMSAG025_02181 [Muribaculaceae bacterium]|nr:hypothetical protein IMSAG025_02181 [Muribaculaceae bacterium]